MVSRASSADVSDVSGPGGAPAYRSSLAALLGEAERPSRDVEVSDVTQDSRQATPGSVFIACQGRTSHGVQHAAAAVERGAVAVLWEPAPGLEAPQLPANVVVHAIPGLSRRVGAIADRFFREPSAELDVAGITGTNGKTTTAYLLAQAADAVGRKGAYLGTIGFGRPGALERRRAHDTRLRERPPSPGAVPRRRREDHEPRGLVARARPGARRRRAIRDGGLHEPHP